MRLDVARSASYRSSDGGDRVPFIEKAGGDEQQYHGASQIHRRMTIPWAASVVVNLVLLAALVVVYIRGPSLIGSRTQDPWFGEIPQIDVVFAEDRRFVDTKPKVFYNETGADVFSAWSEIYPSGWVEIDKAAEYNLVGGAPLDVWGSKTETWAAGSQAWAVTLMHQIHCLGTMKSTAQKIIDGEPLDNVKERLGHFPHCIEYLRQAVLCHADLTLEPAMDPMRWPIGTSGWGVTHSCKDWNAVLKAIERRAILRKDHEWIRYTAQ